MQATVMRLGQSRQTIPFGPGSTIQDVLTAAEVDTTNMTVSRNGEPATLGAEASDGDLYTVTPKVQGG